MEVKERSPFPLPHQFSLPRPPGGSRFRGCPGKCKGQGGPPGPWANLTSKNGGGRPGKRKILFNGVFRPPQIRSNSNSLASAGRDHKSDRHKKRLDLQVPSVKLFPLFGGVGAAWGVSQMRREAISFIRIFSPCQCLGRLYEQQMALL